RDLGIFPAKGNAEQERLALELDEFERGYPRLTLSLFMDVVGACLANAEKPPKEGRRSKAVEAAEAAAAEEAGPEYRPHNTGPATPDGRAALRKRVRTVGVPGNAISWRALLGRLGRLNRLKVFDRFDDSARPLAYKELLRPGSVSVIDLSDSG